MRKTMIETIRNSRAVAPLVSAALITCVVALFCATGCASDGQVAATVDGHDIAESAVTEQVQKFRADEDLTEENTWAQWLVDNDQTPESIRQSAIDSLAQDYLITRAIEERGITVDESEVDSEYQAAVEESGGQEELDAILEEMGYTEQTYKEYLLSSLEEKKLAEAIASEDGTTGEGITEEEVMQELANYSELLDGAKKIRVIVTDNEDAAASAAKRINDGESFDAVADEVSTSNEYDGWDVLISFNGTISEAIEDLEKGDVTEVIASQDDGRYYIVKIEDVLKIGKSGITKKSDVPEDVYMGIEDVVKEQSQAQLYQEYIEGLVDGAEIVVNPMPEGLPYDVSTEGIEKSEDAVEEDDADSVESADNEEGEGADGEEKSYLDVNAFVENLGLGLEDEEETGDDAEGVEAADTDESVEKDGENS